MFHERDGLEAGVPGGKECLRRDSSNPEHLNFNYFLLFLNLT